MTARTNATSFILMLFLILSSFIVKARPIDPIEGEKTWIRLDYPSVYLDKMTVSESKEQIRDWLLMAVIARELPDSVARNLQNALYDLAPLRHDYIHPFATEHSGLARSVPLANRQVLMLVPTDSIEQRLAIQHQVDLYRMTYNQIPDSIRFYEYRIASNDVAFRAINTVSGTQFFTKNWGYQEASISDEGQLKTFLSQINDLTYCHITSDSKIQVGGRRYNQPTQNITTEHIATLYAASKISEQIGFSLDVKVQNNRLAALLRGIAKGEESAFNVILTNQKLKMKERIILIAALQKRAVLIGAIAEEIEEKEYAGWEEYMSYLGGDFAYYNLDNPDGRHHIPQDAKQMLDEIRKDSADACPVPLRVALIQFRIKNELSAVPIISDTVWFLMRDQAPNTNEELTLIQKFLAELMDSASVEEPRFIPSLLDSTEVGMILFYTDFALKANSSSWGSMLYNAVREPINYSRSAVHRQYTNLYPYSRLWFSPQDAGFDTHQDELLFSYSSTQLNVQSRKNIRTAKDRLDVEPTYNAALYSRWWMNHFESIADYEQQYHRLDQLMKWSLIMRWAKRNKTERAFAFLDTVNIRRDYHFVKWYANEPNLRLRNDLPTLPLEKRGPNDKKVRFNFKQIKSSGGVELCNKKTFDSHVARKAEKVNPNFRPERDVRYSNDNQNVTYDGKSFEKSENQVVSRKKDVDILRGHDKYVEAPVMTRNVLPNTTEGFGQTVSYGQKSVFRAKIQNSSTSSKLSIEQDRITPLENLSEEIIGLYNPIRVAADFPNTTKLIRLGDEGFLTKLKGDESWTIGTGSRTQLHDFKMKNPLLAIETGNNTLTKVSRVMSLNTRQAVIKSLQPYSYRRLIRMGEERKIVLDFAKEAPVKETGGKVIPKENFNLQTPQRTIILRGEEVNGYKFSPQATTPVAKKLTESDLDMLHGVRYDVFHALRLSSKKARAFFYSEDGQFLSLTKKGKWNSRQAELTQTIIKSESSIKGLVFNKKAKGVRLLDGSLLEMRKRPTVEEIAIAKQVTDQVNRFPKLAKIHRQFDNITADDCASLEAIKPTNEQLYQDYVALRNLKPSDLDKNIAVASLRTANETPQYLSRKAGGKVEVVTVDAAIKVDFDNLSERIDNCKSIPDLLKATEPEAEFIKAIRNQTKTKTLVTLENESSPLSASKIAALHGDNGYILRDNPNVGQNLAAAKDTVSIRLDKTIVLSVDEKLPYNFSLELEDSLRAFGVAILRGCRYSDFLAKLRDEKQSQIILLTDDKTTEEVLHFADRNVSAEELTNDVRRVSKGNDYIYFTASTTYRWQDALAASGKFKRVLAQYYDKNYDFSNYSGQNIRQFFNKIIDYGGSKHPRDLDRMLRDIQNSEIEKVQQIPLKKQSFQQKMEQLKAIFDTKVDIQTVSKRHSY